MDNALSTLSQNMPLFNGCVTCAGILPTREPIEELPIEIFKRVQEKPFEWDFYYLQIDG